MAPVHTNSGMSPLLPVSASKAQSVSYLSSSSLATWHLVDAPNMFVECIIYHMNI